MKYLFYDLETTGTNFWQHGIHQISGIVDIDGEVKETFDFKVQPNPQARIEDSAMEVGNVTREQIMEYPPMSQVHRDLIRMLDKYVSKYDKKDKFFLIGFNNAQFDNQFFRAFFVQNGNNYFGSYFWANPLDVYVLATEHLLEMRPKMADFKLKTACAEMGIVVDESKLHDATYDVELTRQLYYSLKK